MKTNTIRDQFPIFRKNTSVKRLIYFDNACTVLKPKQVVKAISDYYLNLGACGGNRSSHRLSWVVQELTEDCKEKVKRFINASSSKEIVWTRNTTEGINLLAASFPLNKSKNEVVLTALEHHSNLLPFYEQSKRRHFKIKIAEINKNGGLDLDSLKRCVTDKTALVAVSHMSNVTGLINPVKDIAYIAHKKGAKILVDDAQYVASHTEDVRKNHIDFLVFSGHKIGGPTGIGALYAKEPNLKTFLPFNVGGGTVQRVDIIGGKIKVKYLPSASRFEAGTQDNAGIIGLGAAIDFLEDVRRNTDTTGLIHELACHAYEQLKTVDEAKFLANYHSEKPASLISFYLKRKNVSLYDFNLFLNHSLKGHFIAVRCGHHCAQPIHNVSGTAISMRLSFFIYNTKHEIDIFMHALKDFLRR